MTAANVSEQATTDGPPNVVVILADDLGYSDLGCYGGEINTPVLDRLGRAGVRMTRFYSTPRCAPSRSSLLTGLHPHQTGIGDLNSDDRPWGYPGALSERCETMAEVLRTAGYATSLSGKWHLSNNLTEPDDSWPTRRGFEEFYGIIGGATNYFRPRHLRHNEEPCPSSDDPDYFFTDAIADHAVGRIKANAAANRPFFSYVAFTAPHFPLHAPEPDIAAYDGAYDTGWDDLRRARLRRMVAEGILPEHVDLGSGEPGRPTWDEVPDKSWQARRMQVYAAQVERMDRAIGRIVAALEDTGTLANTVVLFLSDNGACAEPAPPPRDGRPMLTPDGQPVRVGNDPAIPPGPADTHTSYGPDWASLSNTPFRLYKRWAHEGGIATPFIAHWPGGGLADGTIIDHPYQLIDILPTILAVTGANAPTNETGLEPEGRSMLPSLCGESQPPGSPMFWEHIGNCAIRLDQWKLVREAGQHWELYDIDADPIEQTDLAPLRPEIVGRLVARWQAWANQVGVIPFDSIEQLYQSKRRYLPHDRDRSL